MNKETVIKQPETTIKSVGKYFEGVGRRKRSIARVRLFQGKGKVYLNNIIKENIDQKCLSPLIATGMLDKFDVSIKVSGGGIKGQIEAIRHGISRSLVKFDEALKPSLRKAGYMTRDPREKERKKPGLKRARKAPQWQKR